MKFRKEEWVKLLALLATFFPKSGFSAVFPRAPGPILQAVNQTVTAFFTVVKQVATQIVQTVKSAVGQAVEIVQGFVGNVVQTVQTAVSQTVAVVKQIAVTISPLLKAKAALSLLAAFPVLMGLLLLAGWKGQKEGFQRPTSSAIQDAQDDLEADLETLKGHMSALAGIGMGNWKDASGWPFKLRNSWTSDSTMSALEILAEALREARAGVAFIRNRRQEISASLTSLASSIKPVAHDLSNIAGDSSVLGNVMRPIGEDLQAKDVFEPRFRCKGFDLEGGVHQLGAALSVAGNGFNALGGGLSGLPSPLLRLSSDLGDMAGDIKEGGRALLAFGANTRALLEDVSDLGSSTGPVSDGLAAAGQGIVAVGTATKTLGAKVMAFGVCRQGINFFLPARNNRNQKLAAGMIDAGSQLMQKGEEMEVQGASMIGESGTLRQKGNSLIASANKIESSMDRFNDFIGQFGNCADNWILVAPDYTQSPQQMDTHAAYAYYSFSHPSTGPILLQVEGEFPHAAYLGFTTYDTSTGKLHRSLLDKKIQPVSGSTNPFLFGERIHASPRDYQVRVIPYGADPVTNSIEMPPPLSQGTSSITLVARVYLPEPDHNRFGGKSSFTNLDLPKIKSIDESNGDVVCPGSGSTTINFDSSAGAQPPLAGVDRKIYFYRPPLGSAPFPDGEALEQSTAQCTGYLVATLSENKVSVVRMKRLPQYFDNVSLSPEALFEQTDVRYFSLGATGAEKNYQYEDFRIINPATKRRETHRWYGNAAGTEIKLSPDGHAYFAVIPKSKLSNKDLALVVIQAEAMGYNLLSLPKKGGERDPFLVYRNKVAAAGFQGSTSNVPCYAGDISSVTPDFSASGDPAGGMGDYAPEGRECQTVEDFLTGTCAAGW